MKCLEMALSNVKVFTSAPLSPSQVFNQAAFRAQRVQELTDAVADFLDYSIVIPPTEIQNEAMLTSIVGFQKKLLRDRLRPADPAQRLDVKPCSRGSFTYTRLFKI